MTREEANNILVWVLYKVMLSNDDNPYCTPPNADEQKQAIKIAKDALNALDKIRAEIKDWQVDIHDNEYDADKHDFVFERIFEIIDEYKAESEDK